ncbi:MAG: TonB-dependent receptor [Thermodesulfobacteriota bacterium]|nr:TonB-dependent receptor [Thermodesulfobacteriota bacterium]
MTIRGYFIFAIGIFSLITILSAPAGADTPDYSADNPTDNTAEMDKMVVTATRTKEKKQDVNANITVIDAFDIQYSTAEDLGELLNEYGVGVSRQYPGASTQTGVRGFRTDTFGDELCSHVLIMINGRRAGTGNTAKIMTKNIERVEVIRGPASVQYGSAAMGGVINVITKQGTEQTELFAEGTMGSHRYGEISAGGSGKAGNFDFAVDATHTTAHDYYTGDNTRFYNTGYEKKQSVTVNTGYEFLPANRIGLFYSSFNGDEIGLPGYLSANDLDDYKNTDLESFDLTYDGATPDRRFEWKGRYFQTVDENASFDPSASDPSMWSSDNDDPYETEAEQQGAQAQAGLTFGGTRILAGIDWTHYDISSDDYAPYESEYDNPAVFLSGRTKLVDRHLILSAGARYDDYEVKITRPTGRTVSSDNVVTQAGAIWLFSEHLRARVKYGEAFAMPAAKELAYDYADSMTHYVGNPGLKPEKSSTYEAGIDYSRQAVDAAVTYFFTDFENKIETVTIGGGQTTTWRNVGKARLQGIEGSVSMDLGLLAGTAYCLKPYASAIYMAEYEDRTTGRDLMYTPEFKAAYGLSMTDYNGFFAKLNFVYTDSMAVMDYETTGQRVTIDGHTVADLIIRMKLADVGRKGKVSLKTEILNLFDKNYAHVKGYPMPGARIFAGLRIDY